MLVLRLFEAATVENSPSGDLRWSLRRLGEARYERKRRQTQHSGSEEVPSLTDVPNRHMCVYSCGVFGLILCTAAKCACWCLVFTARQQAVAQKRCALGIAGVACVAFCVCVARKWFGLYIHMTVGMRVLTAVMATFHETRWTGGLRVTLFASVGGCLSQLSETAMPASNAACCACNQAVVSIWCLLGLAQLCVHGRRLLHDLVVSMLARTNTHVLCTAGGLKSIFHSKLFPRPVAASHTMFHCLGQQLYCVDTWRTVLVLLHVCNSGRSSS
jgi:hypothetical protein